ncbi:NAD(P)/FAD-dependent oxidoreductase [Tropicimonas sp. IMCC34043]|uniref:FAD/NAD(P)-dependent oxidoreductase n=1 Tax=Tropicimonas sp. IMCC34043 TaxID=2248760 RepID=UPI000E22AC6D|nr:NAD(P)/FAD-dependent oxidoreductase [Tropicimonas sp. IMCC34043]
MTARLHVDVAVIGAGPGGLAAARAAAEGGARVVCLDLFAAAGGQYHMQPTQPESRFAQTPQVLSGRDAARAARSAGVEILTRTEVFWVAGTEDGGYCLSACQAGAEALSIRATTLVVASGAMERPLPFPGWTLPGVIGAGAAQRLLKTGTGALPVPGKAVLAGSGPFLMAVAQTFAKAGQPLAHFVEYRRPNPRATARLLARHLRKLAEAFGLLRDLRRSGAERHFGHIVTRALGKDRLEAVEIAPIDASGRPDPARVQRIEGVGTLAIGYGFQPVTDVTAALGADHGFDPALGGWHCIVDPATGASSRPGLYAAGEVSGIGGASPARLSGRIAGSHAAAAALGRAAPDAAIVAPLAAELAAARGFARGLAALYPPLPDLPLDLAPDEVLCRCEDVTLAEVRAAVADGARETFAVKMWTRAGMGPCQGRICGAAIAAELRRAGTRPEAAGFNRPHLPLRPTPLPVVRAALAAERGST